MATSKHPKASQHPQSFMLTCPTSQQKYRLLYNPVPILFTFLCNSFVFIAFSPVCVTVKSVKAPCFHLVQFHLVACIESLDELCPCRHDDLKISTYFTLFNATPHTHPGDWGFITSIQQQNSHQRRSFPAFSACLCWTIGGFEQSDLCANIYNTTCGHLR